MKNIFLFLLLLTFSVSAISQEKNESLTSLNNLSKKGTEGVKSFSALKDLPKLSSSDSKDYQKLSLKEKGQVKKYRPKDFRFNFIPYAWFMSNSGKIGVGNIPAPYPNTFYFHQSFSEALKKLKMAAMLAGNFRYKQFSLEYDFIYANLKRFGATPENSLAALQGVTEANTTMKEFLLDAAISYFIPMKSPTIFINPYIGMRMWDMEAEATLTVQDYGKQEGYGVDTTLQFSKSQTYVDPIIGINSEFNINKMWYTYFKFDVGGFGVNSQFEMNFVGGVGYRFSRNWDMSLGYKQLGVDYHKTANVWDVIQYGFLLSVGYRYL